jgi:AcrR family transcriptional regulator
MAVAASRAETLRAAVQLASVVGLEGITIGALAAELGMSKSGLVGRFGSKEELQLAALEEASSIFRQTVYDPAADRPSGLRRLNAICDAWIDYLRSPPFPGGCFLTSASVEFDGRPGAVNDAVKRFAERWLAVLEREARVAVDAGELPAATDPGELAFILNALAVGANCDFQLRHDPRSLDRARAGMAAAMGGRARGASGE